MKKKLDGEPNINIWIGAYIVFISRENSWEICTDISDLDSKMGNGDVL